MDKQRALDIVSAYYRAVCEAYRLGNTESAYNAPIIELFSQFGCAPRDMSGERKGQTGENIDIKLWHTDEEVTETEPFAGIEVKKVEGIDKRALSQIKTEAKSYGNAILTDNLVWQFWRSGEEKMYSGVQLIEKDGTKLNLKSENIELFVSLVEDFLLKDPTMIRSSNRLAEYMAMHYFALKKSLTSGFCLLFPPCPALPGSACRCLA